MSYVKTRAGCPGNSNDDYDKILTIITDELGKYRFPGQRCPTKRKPVFLRTDFLIVNGIYIKAEACTY